MVIQLEKAPKILNLAKKADISLKKVNLTDHKAKVALCLDISGSMTRLYSSGKIQQLAEKILALGCRFDDNGSIDIFLFGANAHNAGEMTIDNFTDFIANMLREYRLERGTNYGKVMKLIRNVYFPDGNGEHRNSPAASTQPVYVMFVTDGATQDVPESEQQVKWSSYEPIFWQFMAIDDSPEFLEQLDNMSGRYVDNANFFSVEDPEMIGDEQLYDLLMTEYPNWLRLATQKSLLR
jgi:hypothetical protein